MSNRAWMVVLCGGSILAIALGFRQALGLFMPGMTTELGIGRESFALGIGLMNLFWGLGAPITGAIADKYGSVLMLVISGVAYAAGLAIMTIGGSGDQLIVSGVVLGLATSGAGFSVIMGVVGRAAPPEKQGMALGIASMLGSVGQFAALPYAHVLIEGYGWLNALLILAVCSLVIAPLAFGLANGNQSTETQESKQTLKEAFVEASSSSSYWLLTVGFFVCGFQVVFVGVHLPAFLADKGFAPWLGVTALTLVGLGNIIGSFTAGVLGDRYSRKYLLSSLYFTRSIIIALYIFTPITATSTLLFSFAIGLLWLSTVPLTSGLIAKIFGTTYMSMLFGITFLSHQVGSFFGSWMGGRIFDSMGSYDIVWWVSIALGVAAGLIHWPISEQPTERLSTSSS